MIEKAWLVLGLASQAMFAGRFLIQWLASEKAKRTVIPDAFWYLSIAGAVLLFVYAVHRRDPVFIIGQIMGLALYSRSLWLAHHGKKKGLPD